MPGLPDTGLFTARGSPGARVQAALAGPGLGRSRGRPPGLAQRLGTETPSAWTDSPLNETGVGFRMKLSCRQTVGDCSWQLFFQTVLWERVSQKGQRRVLVMSELFPEPSSRCWQSPCVVMISALIAWRTEHGKKHRAPLSVAASREGRRRAGTKAAGDAT